MGKKEEPITLISATMFVFLFLFCKIATISQSLIFEKTKNFHSDIAKKKVTHVQSQSLDHKTLTPPCIIDDSSVQIKILNTLTTLFSKKPLTT